MRWLLAGLAFALLTGLAVFTVAVKARSLAARARIAVHNEEIIALRVERARRDQRPDDVIPTEDLLARLRQAWRRARELER